MRFPSLVGRADREGDPRVLYFKGIAFKRRFILIVGIIAVMAGILSFSVGTYHIDFVETYRIIWDYLATGPDGTVNERIVWELRVPRGIMAIFVGGGLAAAGCVMQSMLRNPLADPYTTGVSSGAGLGASMAIVLGVSILPLGDTVSVISNAFLMSLIPAAIILAISSMKRITSTSMILVGIGVMYVFSAITQMLKLIATPTQMEELYRWQLGSLSECTLGEAFLVGVVVVLCVSALYRYKNHLNLLSIGDDPSLTMGVNPWRTRVVCLVIVSFMTAVVVSFTGTIGFVGLVAPQMVRTFIGSDNRYLLPASMMFGAAFLVACDVMSRMIGVGGIPVGVVTAIIGSPIFLYLLVKRSRKPTI
ncbi:MAG: iron ABC transporter permease [Candidatus Methanomethylophilaceae archaeon]|nr:iron ABC transporter permease [Candidatus Methanomethylophilaceae archaeon]